MKANPHIDELLCSFIDGELPLRQQTEVQRLVARDPDVARRLRQLQDCKTLMSALPREEAPGEMLEQITFALERRTLLAEQPVSPGASAGVRHLMLRRLVAAAAMIALLAVLGAVVYQIVAPVPPTGPPPSWVDRAGQFRVERDRTAETPTALADSGFSGRLEIRTAALLQMHASIKSAIEDNGLSDLVDADTAGNRRIYRLVGTREGINRLVTSLGSLWQNFDAVTLHVERPGEYANAVVVETVTPEQATRIVAQENGQASVEAARGYAVLNSIARDMPGREVLALIRDDTRSALPLTTIPKPKITGRDDTAATTVAPPQGDAEASLTIVLFGTK